MLGSDLTFRQFKFCEEYLQHFVADKAFRVAYPNCKNRGAPNILKSRKVQEYLRERLEQKKHTIERLTDRMHQVLHNASYDPDPDVRLEATKQISKLKEIEARIKELEARIQDTDSDNEKVVINLNGVKLDEDNNA